MKRMLALLLTLLLAGCSSPAASNPDATALPPAPPTAPVSADNAPPAPERDDLTTVRWWIVYSMRMDDNYMQNTYQKPAEAMADALNPSLANAGLKLEIIMGGYRDAVEYARMVPPVLASKESYDLISLYSEYTPLYPWIAEGYFKDLGGEIDAHQPILDALDPVQVELARSGGGMPYIPSAIDYRLNNNQSHLFMEEYIAASLKIESVTSLDELVSAVSSAHDAALPYQIGFQPTTLDEFRREDPAFPCFISNDLLFIYDAEGGVASYAHSDVFQRDAERMRVLREAAPDALLITTIRDMTATQNDGPKPFVFSPMHSTTWYDRQEGTMRLLQLSPEKPQIFFSSPFGSYVNVIPAYAEGSSALRFLDWVYGNPDNYMLTCYGAEGVHYKKNQDGSLMFIEENPSGNLGAYIGQNALDEGPDPGVDRTGVQYQLESRNGYELMPWNGFVFDPTPVQNVYESVQKLYLYGAVHIYGTFTVGASGDAVRNGLHGVTAYMRAETPMDDFDLKLAELDAAGMPEVLAECRKQYADYLAATGWKP